MAEKTQTTDYEAVACELFNRLVDMAWECDSLTGDVSALTVEMPHTDPDFARLTLVERHTVAARDHATAMLVEHEEALKRDVSFPWIGAKLETQVGDGGDDEPQERR